MTVDVIVQRDGGLKQGKDIVDALIATVAVALNRGRNELDQQATPKTPVELTTVYRSGVGLGQLAEVAEGIRAEIYRGKIIRIRHQISPDRATTSLTVQRISDFG